MAIILQPSIVKQKRNAAVSGHSSFHFIFQTNKLFSSFLFATTQTVLYTFYTIEFIIHLEIR